MHQVCGVTLWPNGRRLLGKKRMRQSEHLRKWFPKSEDLPEGTYIYYLARAMEGKEQPYSDVQLVSEKLSPLDQEKEIG